MFFSFDSFPTVGIFIPPCSLRIVNNIEILFDYAFVNYFIDLIQLFGYNFSYFTRITISHSFGFYERFHQKEGFRDAHEAKKTQHGNLLSQRGVRV